MTSTKTYLLMVFWAHITYDQLTKEEIDEFGIKLSEFPPMTLNHLRHRIKHIDDQYPWSMSPNILLAMLLIVTLYGIDSGWILSI